MEKKLEGEALAQYWNTLLDRRMSERDEVDRLITSLKGHYVSYTRHYGLTVPSDAAEFLEGLIDFHGEERPYGNKDVPASIAYQLGWDYKRQLCYHGMPENIEQEAGRLHEAVKKELKETGWLYT